MAFSNPETITVNSVAKSLQKINTDNYGSEYLLIEETGEYRMKIRHSRRSVKGVNYDRHNVELSHVVYGTGDTPDKTRLAYIVFEHKTGDSATELGYLGAAFSAFLDAGAYADLIAWSN